MLIESTWKASAECITNKSYAVVRTPAKAYAVVRTPAQAYAVDRNHSSAVGREGIHFFVGIPLAENTSLLRPMHCYGD
jgi:hypothetical protein